MLPFLAPDGTMGFENITQYIGGDSYYTFAGANPHSHVTNYHFIWFMLLYLGQQWMDVMAPDYGIVLQGPVLYSGDGEYKIEWQTNLENFGSAFVA